MRAPRACFIFEARSGWKDFQKNHPALEGVERALREFPKSHAQIALGENADLMNPEIANTAKPGVAARSDVIVIADRDICVGRDFLRVSLR
jgi:hypothetical protein